MTDSKTAKHVSGIRVWDIAYIKAECPFCCNEVRIKPEELIEEEIWYWQPFEQECDSCHEYFWVEVDDDDR